MKRIYISASNFGADDHDDDHNNDNNNDDGDGDGDIDIRQRFLPLLVLGLLPKRPTSTGFYMKTLDRIKPHGHDVLSCSAEHKGLGGRSVGRLVAQTINFINLELIVLEKPRCCVFRLHSRVLALRLATQRPEPPRVQRGTFTNTATNQLFSKRFIDLIKTIIPLERGPIRTHCCRLRYRLIIFHWTFNIVGRGNRELHNGGNNVLTRKSN